MSEEKANTAKAPAKTEVEAPATSMSSEKQLR